MLLHDSKPEIRQLLRFASGDALQLDALVAFAAEEPDATAEQHGSKVDHDLVE